VDGNRYEIKYRKSLKRHRSLSQGFQHSVHGEREKRKNLGKSAMI